MYLVYTEPELRDAVRHKSNDTTGLVISKYPKNDEQFLDVRGIDDRIYYGTPAKNWMVIKKNDE